MAITLVGSPTNTTYASRTNTTVNAPTGLADGDCVLLGIVTAAATNAPDPTAPAGFTITGISTSATDGSFVVEMRVYIKIASAEGASWTLTHASCTSQGFAIAYRGVDQSTPQDATAVWQGRNTNGGADVDTPSTAPSITTVTNNALVLFVEQDWASTANNLSPPTGTTPTFTEQLEVDPLIYLADGILATAGATGTKSITNNAGAGGAWAAGLIALRPAATGPVGITKVADRGSTQNLTGAASDTVGLAAGGSIAVGNYLIARVAVDNSGTNGAKPGLTVTDARNTWTLLDPANSLADPGAANAGSACYVAYARVANAYSNADNVTFTWGTGSPPAKALVVEEWSGIDPNAPVAVAAVGATAATSPADISITPTAAGQLVYTCLATEGPTGDTAPVDSSPTNGTWVTLTRLSTTSGTAASNQTVAGQYNLTATAGVSNQWNPTITARDWAAIAVVFAFAYSPNPDRYTPTQQAQRRAANW